MDISLFQILILLLLIYPLLRRILGGPNEEKVASDEVHGDTDPWLQQEERDAEMTSKDDSKARPASMQNRSSSPSTYPETSRSASPGASRESSRASSRKREKERGEQTWEDFFEGLEQVLSGKEPEEPSRSTDTASRHPSHGPVYNTGKPSPETYSPEPHSSSPYTYDKYKAGKKIGEQSEQIARDLIDEKNPIYTGLDEDTKVTVTTKSSIRNIKGILQDPEKLGDAIILKEILGPPKSRRKHHHLF